MTEIPNIETHVLRRYAQAAQAPERALCCPVDYEQKYLAVLPPEIIERDYGCGDPSRFVKPGDTVLDLGSGAGKICYIASQIVGPEGRVIGVDFNPAMLELARRHQSEIARRIGWDNDTFRRGKIQDLRTDYERLAKRLGRRALGGIEDYLAFEEERKALASSAPMIADGTVDLIVSNCVLNLVRADDKRALFSEMKRVLKKGGRVAISDIVADEPVPDKIRFDPDLWTGCIAGAFQEQDFLRAFEEAGFYGIGIARRDERPWRTIEGVEFRSITVTAYKGKEGPCLERFQAAIYKGPWREVRDDDGHVFRRGVPTAVCDKTLRILSAAPYQDAIIPLEPLTAVPIEAAQAFDCQRSAIRQPSELKGAHYNLTTLAPCSDSSCC
jgi:SAM-dependent methyltransferase